MTIGSPVLREHQPQFGMTVAAVADLGGGMRRVTVEAPELASFERCGPDEYVSLMMPRRGADLVLPDPGASNVRAALAELPDGVRPDLRWYTIRSHDRSSARIDIDIVTHGDAGPGSAWACRVRPGDRAGLRAAGALNRGTEVVGRQLLVADETAVPSVAAVLEALGGATAATARGVEVHVEVPDLALLTAYDLGDAEVHVRRGAPGSALVPALDRHLAAGGAPVAYAWACGESSLAAGARRALVRHGVDRRHVYFCGFWKVGQPRG
ncbi:MAG: siderophore-interacting protein [Dermatophilaceae bacterium]